MSQFRAQFIPVQIELLMSAATMLFTPSFHRRPVKIFEDHGQQYFVSDVQLDVLGNPVWVIARPVREVELAEATWTYRVDNKKVGFAPVAHGLPKYFYDFENNLALMLSLDHADGNKLQEVG
jgi:hypothetical protein